MHFTYGFCDANVGAVSRKYKHLYSDWRQPNRDVFMTIHHSLKETCTFIPPAHWLWQTLCQMKRKCSMLYMLICQVALLRLHMNRASLRMYLGIHYMRNNCILCMYILYKGYSQGTVIFPSCSADGFYTKLQMNLIIDLRSTTHKEWSKQSPQPT